MHNGFHSFNHLNCAQQQTETNVNAHKHKHTRSERERASESEKEKRTKHSYQMYRTSFAFLLFVCLFARLLACLFAEYFFHSFIRSFFVLFVSFLVYSFNLSSSPSRVRWMRFFTFIRISYPRCWFDFVIVESIHWMALWFAFFCLLLLLLLLLFIFHFTLSCCPTTIVPLFW